MKKAQEMEDDPDEYEEDSESGTILTEIFC